MKVCDRVSIDKAKYNILNPCNKLILRNIDFIFTVSHYFFATSIFINFKKCLALFCQ